MSGISEMDKEVWLELSGSPLSLRALESKNRRNPKIKMESPDQSSNFTVLLQKAIFAKPFTILTGNSGTGKTRSAEDLAAMFRDADDLELAKNVALVAVGADWTDNRNVVGYVNHLREAKMAGAVDSRPVYQSTPVLDLLLEASKPGREAVPHFLILDEMNLSHVERYFADFLSAMEARSGAIRFHEEGDFRLPRFEEDPVGVPRSLPYPQNLFVIGTVNVDETTYMFSPKVLDRAHVIEFEVDPEDVKAFLDDPKPLQPVPRAAAGQAEAFLVLSLRARGAKEPPLPELPPAVKTAVNKHLLEVLEILQNGRFEFAFRTAKEVVAYLKVSCELAADKAEWESTKWKSDLDDEILQKILPKLSGSKRRIEALLVHLARYCETGAVPKKADSTPADYQSSPVKRDNAAKREFPRSHDKLCDMIDTVRRDQFVSFIH
jgi:5-methylcytosine-specific restriction protein B